MFLLPTHTGSGRLWRKLIIDIVALVNVCIAFSGLVLSLGLVHPSLTSETLIPANISKYETFSA